MTHAYLARQGLNETSHESEESRDVRVTLVSWRVSGEAEALPPPLCK